MRNRIYIVLFLLFLFSSCSISHDVYWEEIEDRDRENVLLSSAISHSARMAYQNEFQLSDNETSENLLKELTSNSQDKKVRAFRFFLLNRICESKDGAFAEMFDEYVFYYMINNVNYVLNYVANKEKLLDLYAECISAGLYFKEKSLIDFEKALSSKINSKNKGAYKKFLNEVKKHSIDEVERLHSGIARAPQTLYERK